MHYYTEDDEKKHEEQIEILQNEIDEMQTYFFNKSEPIIKKCMRKAERIFRDFKEISCILSDDYDYLNTFEQICYIIQERSTSEYFGLDYYINGTIEDVFDNLTEEEKFILNHSGDEEPVETIRSEFFRYCGFYSNKNIKKAIYS